MTSIAPAVAEPGTLVPGRTELFERARALREQLWRDAEECDRRRRLTDASFHALTDSGLTRLMTPRRFGGYQTDMRTFLDVTAELGRGCCSTAWLAGVLNAGNFVASLFPEQAQHEVWADDPGASAALVLGAPVAQVEDADGGLLVTGRWAYASGVMHADWVSVLIPRGLGGPEFAVHLALLPVAQIGIEDTWHFTGMRGTGSNTVVAERLFVPAHRVLPFMPVVSGQTDSFVPASHRYRNSLMGLFSIGLLGAQLGGAARALDHVLEQAPSRPVAASTYRDQTQSPTFQLDVAEASTLIDTALLLAGRLADTVDQHAAAGTNPDLVLRGRARMDSTRVAEYCREALGVLMTAYGSSAFNEANPLQRLWRDVNVASRHAGFGMGVPQQLYGRALAGMDPREISYLI